MKVIAINDMSWEQLGYITVSFVVVSEVVMLFSCSILVFENTRCLKVMLSCLPQRYSRLGIFPCKEFG